MKHISLSVVLVGLMTLAGCTNTQVDTTAGAAAGAGLGYAVSGGSGAGALIGAGAGGLLGYGIGQAQDRRYDQRYY